MVWACPDGLAWYGQGGAKIITDGIFTRRQWQAMNPAGIVAARYEGMAFVNYTDADGIRRAFLIDPLNPKGVLFLEKGYDAVYFDELTDSLYVLEAGQVSKWNAGATMMTARFVSKVFLSPPLCYGSARVLADTYPVTLKVDAGPLPAAALASLVARNPARLSAVGSMLRYTVAVQNHVAFRLPAGFQATEWQVTVEATGGVQSVVLGESPKETL